MNLAWKEGQGSVAAERDRRKGRLREVQSGSEKRRLKEERKIRTESSNY